MRVEDMFIEEQELPPVEDIKEEEQSPEAEEAVEEIIPSSVIIIEKPKVDTPAYDDAIEAARQDFSKVYKKGRIGSYIAMGVVLALAVGSVVCIGFQKLPLTIIGWSLVGVAIIGMLIFYLVTRNNLPNATKAYIAVVNKNLNMRNFMDTRFSETRTDPKDKIELSEPVSDAVYSAISNLASRNVITGKFDKRSFKVADLGLYSGQGKSRKSAFVGKYVSYPNDLHFEGRYIISIKGKTPVDLPTDINDLVLLEDSESFSIYGREGAKFNSELGKEFISKLKDIDVKNHLLNVNFVIWSGHSAVYASYSDEIMTLPFDKDFDKTPNEQYASNLLEFFEALSLLKEKKK